mgnify:CR=1 FL=1
MKQYVLYNPHAGNGTAEEAAKIAPAEETVEVIEEAPAAEEI